LLPRARTDDFGELSSSLSLRAEGSRAGPGAKQLARGVFGWLHLVFRSAGQNGLFCIFPGVEFFIALLRSAEKGPVFVEVISRVGFRIVRIVKTSSPPEVKNSARGESDRILSENRFSLAMQRAFCGREQAEGRRPEAGGFEFTFVVLPPPASRLLNCGQHLWDSLRR
jgi:hypothetical protein